MKLFRKPTNRPSVHATFHVTSPQNLNSIGAFLDAPRHIESAPSAELPMMYMQYLRDVCCVNSVLRSTRRYTMGLQNLTPEMERN